MLANNMEANMGFQNTTKMINMYRDKQGLTPASVSAVIYKFKLMKPQVTKIKKQNQGNVVHEAWNTARFNQTKKMCVMLGKITLNDLVRE